MELISVIALGVLGLIGAAFSKLLADEFKAWLPTILNYLIGWAISSLPEDKRERYAEEWRSGIDETPGEIGKLIFGLGLLRAAWRLSRMSPEPTSRQAEEIVAAIRYLGRWQRRTFVVKVVMLAAAREQLSIVPKKFDQQTASEVGDLIRRIAVEDPGCDPIIRELAADLEKAGKEGFERGYRETAAAAGRDVQSSDVVAALARALAKRP